MDARIMRVVEEDGIASHIKDVFLACYEEIVERRITTIAALLDFMADLPWHPGLDKVIRKAARLIRELNWGVFRELEIETYPKLWKTLVIPDRRYRELGDLKRNMTVPNTYCALMDIHAYTEFCQKHRHNFSMLNLLDTIMQEDTRDIARKYNCISFRAAGDNVLLIGTSPGDIIRACLGIVDCFSRRRAIKDTRIAESRRGAAIILQDIFVTAGIAGGVNYSSLVITGDGDISGSIVNSAARLQAFANSVSPDRSSVMVTGHVHSGYKREMRNSKDDPDGFEFFSCGKVHFKGGALSVHEVVFTESDFKKLRYQKKYREVWHSLQRGGWKENLLAEVIGLVIEVLETVPVKRLEAYIDGESKVFSTSSIIGLAEHALEAYESEQDHRRMAERLKDLLSIVELVRGFDKLVLLHFGRVVELFDKLAREYESIQFQKIMENEIGLFSQVERRVLANADKFEKARDQLIERGKKNNNIYSASVLWNKVISESEKDWDFNIYSGKP